MSKPNLRFHQSLFRRFLYLLREVGNLEEIPALEISKYTGLSVEDITAL